MNRKQILKNYQECYGKKRHLSTLWLRDKSRGKVRNRIAALLLLFGAGAACIAVTGRTITSSVRLPRADTPAAHVEAPPRQLHPHDCGLDPREQRDRESISLLTVRHADLTTIGCPGGAEDFRSVCLKREKRWMIIFYLFGVFYMFIGIAIVCDEFFVPALESFVDICGISMDVAGATFMAAGGSMPELATSFISTFNDDNVGFAAIVGSAVFNVLFVIAVCAIASKEILELTAWPLARDATFYLIALFTVVGVFSNSKPATITWWEACLLLLLYVTYCTFMKFNGMIEEVVMGWLRGKKKKVVPKEDDEDLTPKEIRKDNRKGFKCLRKGIVTFLTQDTCVDETLGIAAVMSLQGDLDRTFDELDKDKDGILSPDEMLTALSSLGLGQRLNKTKIETAFRRLAGKAEGKEGVTKENFKRWYIASESRIEYEVENVFKKFDTDKNGTIDVHEITRLLAELGHELPAEHAAEDIIEEILAAAKETGDQDGAKEDEDEDDMFQQKLTVESSGKPQVNFHEFSSWYLKSIFGEYHKDQHELEADELVKTLDLDPPWGKPFGNWFWYVFSYPILAALYCTMPDVREYNRKRENQLKEASTNSKITVMTINTIKLISVVEFTCSLVWIAAFANCLYEWTVVCCFTIGVPPEVAAVTVLAAGTSIPDLLSSYIVAKNGEGDMAVSSSIGSNIFDVTVGLPLPWLCYNILCAHKAPVKVEASNIGFSIIVLIIMLLCVIITIMAMKWRMTKPMGYVMLVLYFVFVAQDLLQQLPKSNPVIQVNF